MCGIYGMYNYGNELRVEEATSVIRNLGVESMTRGTDATGIAFVENGRVKIQKAAKKASRFEVQFTKPVRAVTGHTRQTTQGNHRYNQNNHPFYGRAGGVSFALAHNGIIWNDDRLRVKYRLPKTQIKTDSYAAVQLLEKSGKVTAETIKTMVEQLEGVYCFTILDSRSRLYLVKGTNPMAVLHDRVMKAYFYASTREILLAGLSKSLLVGKLNEHLNDDRSSVELLEPTDGSILTLEPDGTMKRSKFEVKAEYYGRYGMFCDIDDDMKYGSYSPYTPSSRESYSSEQKKYIEHLQNIAVYLGFDEVIVDELLAEGFTLDEIEQYLYDFDDGCVSGYYEEEKAMKI